MFTYQHQCPTRFFTLDLKSLRMPFHIQDKLKLLIVAQKALHGTIPVSLCRHLSASPAFTLCLTYTKPLTFHKHTIHTLFVFAAPFA